MKGRSTVALLMLASALVFSACGQGATVPGTVTAPTPNRPTAPPPYLAPSAQPPPTIPTYSYEIVNHWPHDRTAYTEGLVFSEGALFESTGLNGASSVRRVEIATGRVMQRLALAPDYYGEGLTLFDDMLIQLTWQSHKGLIYDERCFCPRGEFAYDGEGWGLTHDDRSLIMSDGTQRIRFLDPHTFATIRTIDVYDNGEPLTNLNELEYVRGEIYANVWQTDSIVRIDPATGALRGRIDLTGLFPVAERGGPDDLLNGIAYDDATGRLFVTGKNWPTLFEIRLKPPP